MTRQERRKRRRQRRRRMQAGILAVLVVALGLIIALRAGKERETPEPEIPLTAERQSLTYIMPTPVLPDARPAEETPDKPEELTEEPEPENRYAPLHISDEDVYILACLVYHEARGECFEGQVAVIEVVLNRMLSDYFPDTVEGEQGSFLTDERSSVMYFVCYAAFLLRFTMICELSAAPMKV